MIYYKAIRPDGTSFHDPDFRWLPEDGKIPEGGWLVKHPNPSSGMEDASEYLSVSSKPADCIGFSWPCRLLEVEAVGEVTSPKPRFLPNKHAGKAFRVVREADPNLALGPNGARVAALIDRASRLTSGEMQRMESALDAAEGAALDAAGDAAEDAALARARFSALDAARHAATWSAARAAQAARRGTWGAVRVAARNAVFAEVVSELIPPADYNTLTAVWRAGVGDDWTESKEN